MLLSDLYCPSCRNAKDHKPQDNEVCWSCVAMGGAGNYAAWIADHPVVSEYDENNPQHRAWLEWLKMEVDDGRN